MTCADADAEVGVAGGALKLQPIGVIEVPSWHLGTFWHGPSFDAAQLAAMSALRRLSRPRPFVCRQCIRHQHALARGERPAARWADEEPDPVIRQAQWDEHAGRVRAGMHQSMLSVLEERGFVKDVAG